MLQFAAALPDPASEQVMAAALNHLGRRKGGNPPRLIAAPTVSALHRTARSHRVTAAVIRPEAIADPLQSSGSSDRIPTSLRAWLSGQPPIPTVLWASPAWLHPRRTIRLAELGLAEVVLEGEDDAPATFAEVLDRMLEHGTRRRFLEVLPPSLPRDLQELIQSLLAPRLEWPNTREMSATHRMDPHLPRRGADGRGLRTRTSRQRRGVRIYLQHDGDGEVEDAGLIHRRTLGPRVGRGSGGAGPHHLGRGLPLSTEEVVASRRCDAGSG